VLVTHSLSVPLDLLWDEPGLVRVRDRLSRFSRNIWMDFRGWGNSERDLDADASLDDDVVCAQITAVLDAVGCDRVVLAGCGAAGPGAIRYGALYPERVRALIFVNAYASYVRDDDCPWGVPKEIVPRLVDSWMEGFGTGTSVSLFAPSRANDERFRAWAGRSERMGSGPGNYRNRTRAIFERDARPVLDRVTSPTLVIHRRDDKAIRVEAGRYIAAHIHDARYVELPGEDNWFFVGDSDAIIDEIEEFLTGTRAGAHSDVVVSTVLFTDIVDSTAQQATTGRREWSQLAALHDDTVRRTLSTYQGREIKTLGDGFLATFDSATRAIACASEIIVGARNLGLKVRAGIHTGEIELGDHDVAGIAVTIAKRVCDIAPAGQLLVTDTVRSVVIGAGITFDDAGVHQLKGIPDTAWQLYVVLATD
jgi:class 3 adenylate cyclase